MSDRASLPQGYQDKFNALPDAQRDMCARALALAGIGFELRGPRGWGSFDNATAQTIIDDQTKWAAAIADYNAGQSQARGDAYKAESDPLFMKWQRADGTTQQQWLDAVIAIKARFPDYGG